MTVFHYRAINVSGKIFDGKMETSHKAEVAEHLERAGITLISIRESDGNESRHSFDFLKLDPSSEDITGFTLDLAMLLKGGVSLDESLVIMAQMETRRWLVRLIQQLHVELAGGKSFSAVLKEHPALFPPIYVKMIEVAELSGRLEPALSSIALERQRNEKLRKRLVSAMAYPAFLAVAALCVLAFVLLYIIPEFEGAIAGFRDRIAPSALFVFRLSEVFRANTDTVLIVLTAGLLAFFALKQFGKRRAIWIEIFSTLPLTGKIINYHLTLTFCRTLQILLQNGVDISTSLRLIRGISSGARSGDKIDGILSDVRSGKRLSQALAKSNLLPGHVVQMLRVGEEAGNLGESAGRVAGFYEAKLDTALSRLTAVLGPLLMMGVSALIGWLILSIMSALMSINDLLI